jgi:hypothetical protein
VSRLGVHYWLASGAAVSVLASCTSSSLPQTPSFVQPSSRLSSTVTHKPRAAGYIRRTTTQNFLFVSDDAQSCIFVLDPTQPGMPPIGQITDDVSSPAGLATDSRGALYVTNQGASPPSVGVYPPGRLRPSMQLTTGSAPWAVAVDSHGTVYVSDPFASPANVLAFKAGQSVPFETITGFQDPTGLAVDKLDNLFVSDLRNAVYEVPAGSSVATNLNLTDLTNPTSIAVDGQGVLSVSELGNVFGIPSVPAQILRFGPGKTTPNAAISNNVFSPQFLAYGHAIRTLFVTMQDNGGYVAGFKAGQRKASIWGFNPQAAAGLAFTTNSKW